MVVAHCCIWSLHFSCIFWKHFSVSLWKLYISCKENRFSFFAISSLNTQNNGVIINFYSTRTREQWCHLSSPHKPSSCFPMFRDISRPMPFSMYDHKQFLEGIFKILTFLDVFWGPKLYRGSEEFNKIDIELLGFCSCDGQFPILLGYDIVLLGNQFPAFLRQHSGLEMSRTNYPEYCPRRMETSFLMLFSYCHVHNILFFSPHYSDVSL